MSRRKTATILSMLLAFVFVLSACGTTAPAASGTTTASTTSGGTAATTAPPAGGAATGSTRDSLVTYINSDINTLDQTMISLINENVIAVNIYDPLIYMKQGESKTEEMRLAESYTVSDDGLVYTFKLRQGVLFHNGEEMKASDVHFSYETCKASPYRGAQMEQYASSRAVDDYTFELTLLDVYAPVMEIMVSAIQIVSEKAVNELGSDFGLNPVGTGPYVFVSYETTNQIKLTRFDDYYRTPARIKDLTFKIITDPNTIAIALQSGEIDVGSFAATAYSNMMAAPNLTVNLMASNHITYMMMNHEVAPFNDVRVRQAINYALDRDFINEAVMGGLARPASIILSPDVTGYSTAIRGYEYNIEKAKELLAEAGITTPYDLGKLKAIEGSFKTAAQMIQANLADIGLNLEIEVLEATKYIEDAQKGDYAMGVMGMDSGNDADGFNAMVTTPYINSLNMARYSNPEVDRLFAAGRSELNPEARKAIYAECFNLITDDAVYGALYNQPRPFAYNPDLQVDYFEPMLLFPYEMAWK